MQTAPITTSAEAATGTAGDPVLARLREARSWLTGLVDLADDAPAVGEAARIDRIAELERLQSCLEAVKAVEIVRFARSRALDQSHLGVDPRRLEHGLAAEIALAGRVSPTEGARRLHTARDLVLDLPRTLRLLVDGTIHAGTARRITEALSHLDRHSRRQVDRVLDRQRLDERSARSAAAAASRAAYEVDPVGSLARSSQARSQRRVTLRPVPDTMSLLTGVLPVEQGVACLAALQAAAREAQAAGDTRGQGQVMADTLVARITGQDRAEQVGVEVGIVVPLAALLDPDDPTPAEIPGHGPLPAGLARQLITNPGIRAGWRRLITRPTRAGGQLVVDIDPRRRRFTGGLAELIRWRDQTCRDPFCDAAIRHLDHIRQHRTGGPTRPGNGRGVCERGNYIRELPGWTVRVSDPDSHTVVTTTPTGHRYLSRPPEPP